MNKKIFGLILVVFIALVIALIPKNELQDLFGKKIDEPVFIKSLIYSECMDAELHYIAPSGYSKSINSISIPNAPKGSDCNFYNDHKESKSKYDLVTVYFGIGFDDWNEETGIGESLEIDKLLVTWDDGTKTLVDIGNITIVSSMDSISKEKQQYNHMQMSGTNDTWTAKCTLGKDTNILGISFPFEEEISKTFKDITINNIPIEEISIDNPVSIKSGKECVVQYTCDRDSKTLYGEINVRAFIIGITDGKRDKIAEFSFYRDISSFESVNSYLQLSN
ncbi:MAG: hypothetical protein ACK5MV_06370 [Aminipila sp.]